MFSKIEYLSAICLVLGLILGGLGIASSADTGANQEALYKQALTLQAEGDYNNATEILKKLVKGTGDSKYEINYLDAVLDQCIAMKESKNLAWKPIAKDVGYKIKELYNTHKAEADYWLVYAKFSWLVEAKKEAHITKALEKAQYYNHNNNPQTYILKGDIYADMAHKVDPSEKQDTSSMNVGGPDTTTRHYDGLTAKASYETALSNPSLDNKKKAYIYYKLGELESQILSNPEEAKADWGKAVSASAESRWGNLAKKRLNP